jgi:hypothetical protein
LINIEIPIPDNVDGSSIAAGIDLALVEAELEVTLRASLNKYPGCTHWHVRRPPQAGTLEITWWPREHRGWFSLRKGREADWMDATTRALMITIPPCCRKCKSASTPITRAAGRAGRGRRAR